MQAMCFRCSALLGPDEDFCHGCGSARAVPMKSIGNGEASHPLSGVDAENLGGRREQLTAQVAQVESERASAEHEMGRTKEEILSLLGLKLGTTTRVGDWIRTYHEFQLDPCKPRRSKADVTGGAGRAGVGAMILAGGLVTAWAFGLGGAVLLIYLWAAMVFYAFMAHDLWRWASGTLPRAEGCDLEREAQVEKLDAQIESLRVRYQSASGQATALKSEVKSLKDSEMGQALRAKAKEGWDEILGGKFRGVPLTESPYGVGAAIFLFFPLGLYLLWKHPVLGRNKTWWTAGGVWSAFVSLALINGGKVPVEDRQVASVTEVATVLARQAPSEPGKWGFIDSAGRLRISHRFDYAREFSNGLAAVERNSKWGFVDKNGNMQIDCRYDEVEGFSDGLCPVKSGRYYAIIDIHGNVKNSIKASAVFSYSEGLAAFAIGGHEDRLGDVHNAKWGFIDRDARVVIAAVFDQAFPFHGGRAYVSIADQGAIIDKQGEILLKSDASKTILITGGTLEKDAPIPFREARRDGWSGFMDISGREVIPARFGPGICEFSQGLAPVRAAYDKDQMQQAIKTNRMPDLFKFGYINSAGEWIIAPRFKFARGFHDGLAAVGLADKSGYIDREGGTVVGFALESAGDFHEGIARVQREKGRWGFVDVNGRPLFKTAYADAGDFSEGMAAVKSPGP